MTDRSDVLCCKPADPYCTREAGHWGACAYFAVSYRGRAVEACEGCGGPLNGVVIEGDELLRCASCERDTREKQWAIEYAKADKIQRSRYARQRLNERKRESDEAR